MKKEILKIILHDGGISECVFKPKDNADIYRMMSATLGLMVRSELFRWAMHEVVKTYDADPEGIAKAVNSTGWVMLGADGRQN